MNQREQEILNIAYRLVKQHYPNVGYIPPPDEQSAKVFLDFWQAAQAAAIPAGYVLCKAEPVGEVCFDAEGYNGSIIKPNNFFGKNGVPLYAQETEK